MLTHERLHRSVHAVADALDGLDLLRRKLHSPGQSAALGTRQKIDRTPSTRLQAFHQRDQRSSRTQQRWLVQRPNSTRQRLQLREPARWPQISVRDRGVAFNARGSEHRVHGVLFGRVRSSVALKRASRAGFPGDSNDREDGNDPSARRATLGVHSHLSSAGAVQPKCTPRLRWRRGL